jgi:signal peptidase I
LGVVLFAIAFVAELILFGITWISAPMPAAFAIFFGLGTATILFHIGAAAHAVRHIRSVDRGSPRPWYQSTWIVALIMIGASLGVSLTSTPGGRSFFIASGSMMPGLTLNDRVLADVRPSKAVPTYGDVVAFHSPRPPLADYIKRIVALPGDRVQMKQGILYLNGRPMPRESKGFHAMLSAPPSANIRVYRETLPNGHAFNILQMSTDQPMGNTPEYLVPADAFFVLGDHRDNSLDSRSLQTIGYVPQANVIGIVGTIFWSTDLSRLLHRVE